MLTAVAKKKPDSVKWLAYRALHDWANTFEDMYMDCKTQHGTRFELSDAGFACRFVWSNNSRIRYHAGLQRLGIWNEHKWDFSKEAQAMIYERAIKCARSIKDELEDMSKDQQYKISKTLLNHATASENRIPQMLKVAEKLLMTKAKIFDADPYLLNCKTGLIDLRTKIYTEHFYNQDACINAMCTKICGADHGGPLIEAEHWPAFVSWFCSGNKLLEGFLQRLIGYAALGRNPEEIIIVFKGPTYSGKTTFLEAIKMALGDYAQTAHAESFIKQTFSSASKPRGDLRRLLNARLVIAPEMPKGKPLDVSLLKAMSGGSTMAFRDLYEGEEEGRFPCTLILEGNDWPNVDLEEVPMWRRLIPFQVFQSLKPKEVKPEIKEALLTDEIEQAAILDWVVEGAYQYLQKGLAIPSEAKEMVTTYKAEMNPLKEFLDGYCKFGPDFKVTVWVLKEAYKEYCKEHKQIPATPQVFNRELAERKCEPRRSGRDRKWMGLKLI